MSLRSPTFLAVLLSGALALAAAATPALGQQPQQPHPVLEVAPKAVWQAEGVAIIVRVSVTVPESFDCEPGAIGVGSVSVLVLQRRGNGLVRGGGGEAVRCGEDPQIDVPVLADTTPFRLGTAFALADVTVCDAQRCDSDRGFGEIRIVRSEVQEQAG